MADEEKKQSIAPDEREQVERAIKQAGEERILKEQKEEFEKAKKSELKYKTGQSTDATWGALRAGMYERMGITAGSLTTSKASARKDKADISKAKTEQSKFKEDIDRGFESIEGFFDKIEQMYENDPDGAVALMNAGLASLKATNVQLTFENQRKALEAKMEYEETLIKSLMNSYGLAEGKFDLAYLRNRAKDIVGDKPSLRREGLDKLLEQGAPEIAMPEMPDDMNAYLAEVVMGTIGDITQNAIAWASGGTTAVATASVPSAGQQVMANVATMMSMDVEQHREKVEKIRLLNEELRIKYEGDVINAMIEFDARADASEQAYNQMRFQATAMEISNAFRVLDMKDRADEFISNIGRFIDNVKNQEAMINEGREFEARKFSVDWRNRFSLAEMQYAYNTMLARDRINEAKLKNKYVPYDDISGALPFMYAKGVSTAPTALETAIYLKELNGENNENAVNYAWGSERGKNIYAAIDELDVKDDVKARILNNVLKAATLNYKLLNHTEAALLAIGEEPIETVGAGKGFSSGADAMSKYFRQVGRESASYQSGTMVEMLRGMSSKVHAQREAIKSKYGEKQVIPDLSIFSGKK
jgi:hypothetical protein